MKKATALEDKRFEEATRLYEIAESNPPICYPWISYGGEKLTTAQAIEIADWMISQLPQFQADTKPKGAI